MTPSGYTDDELRIAEAISMHPELVSFDAMNLYSRGPELTDDLASVDEYGPDVCMADVFYVFLATPEERKRYGRNFKFRSALQVVTKRLQMLPHASLAVVDAFPLTERHVIKATAAFLNNTEYAKSLREFIFAGYVYTIDEVLS